LADNLSELVEERRGILGHFFRIDHCLDFGLAALAFLYGEVIPTAVPAHHDKGNDGKADQGKEVPHGLGSYVLLREEESPVLQGSGCPAGLQAEFILRRHLPGESPTDTFFRDGRRWPTAEGGIRFGIF
jgi:hypothetical protein